MYCWKVSGPDINTISIIKSIPNFKKNRDRLFEIIGFIKLDLNARVFFELNSAVSEKADYDIYIKSGNIVLSGSRHFNLGADDISLIMQKSSQGKEFLEYEENNRIYLSKRLGAGCDVLFAYSYSIISLQVWTSYILAGVFIFFIVFILFLISKRISKGLTGKIEVILNKLAPTGGAEANLRSRKRTDELELLNIQLDALIDRLNLLIDENYFMKLESIKTQLDALQLQINPHFLYNTLEAISGLAYTHNCDDIADVAEQLGGIFRYAIDGKQKFVPLSSELEQIKRYLLIQFIRFPQRFTVSYNVPDELMSACIPKLVLQPIVENCINHAFAESEAPVHILIGALEYDGHLLIDIIDDGVGIKTDALVNILDEKTERDNNRHSGIGLNNVNARFKLNYGDKYGMSIDSFFGVYTWVKISVPLSYMQLGGYDIAKNTYR